MFKKNRIWKLLILLICVYLLRVIFSSLNLYYTYPVKPVTSLNIEDYYLEFDYLKEKDAIQLDADNVSFVDYSNIKSLGVKNRTSYNPATVGFMGLRYFQDFVQQNSKKDKNIFIAHAKWLKKNINSQGAWEITHEKSIGKFKMEVPWISSLSQGFGISVLTRAFEITKDSTYLKAARMALNPYRKTLKNGGVKAITDNGIYFEEYPVIEAPNHVLNGFIYSLFGLYDLYKYDNNEDAKVLFDEGINTLKNSLDYYNKGHWTVYSLNKESTFQNHWNYSSPFYQKIHVAQLQGLYLITGDPFFIEYKKKFEEQHQSSWLNFVIYPAYVVYTDYVRIYKSFWNKI